MVEKEYLDYEKAIKLIAKALPSSAEESKPVLMHCIRVGTYLYQNGYSRDIILSGYMHDLLEDTDVSPELISSEFGANVLRIIEANSKDASIKDPDQKKAELIGRCIAAGEEAIIVKGADILDNYRYYEKINDAEEIQYGAKLLKYLLPSLEKAPVQIKTLINNPIFVELKKYWDKYPLK